MGGGLPSTEVLGIPPDIPWKVEISVYSSARGEGQRGNGQVENLKDLPILRVPISTIAIAAFCAAVLIAIAVPVKGGYPTSGAVNVPVILINFPDRRFRAC